jgi:polyhydroxyalkanoate synthesis regulator phasin
VAEPDDMILPLLREMRAEIASKFADNSAAHARTHARLDKVEEQLVTFRQALGADSLMSRLLTGEFEERIEALERRVRELETHR